MGETLPSSNLWRLHLSNRLKQWKPKQGKGTHSDPGGEYKQGSVSDPPQNSHRPEPTNGNKAQFLRSQKRGKIHIPHTPLLCPVTVASPHRLVVDSLSFTVLPATPLQCCIQ